MEVVIVTTMSNQDHESAAVEEQDPVGEDPGKVDDGGEILDLETLEGVVGGDGDTITGDQGTVIEVDGNNPWN